MNKITLAALVIVSINIIGCDAKVTDNQNNNYTDYIGVNYNEQTLENELYKLAYEDLSADEKASLIFMREEEKLARDVYLTFYEMYKMPIFKNIANSEQAHTNAIKYLLTKYSIPDPVLNDTRGVFTNTELANLYNSLIEQGSASDIEALKVGALIEEIDILDIQNALKNIDNNDIIFVYNNLKRGSINHLNSFVKNLSFRGYDYQPVKLSKEEYDSYIRK
jgi:hypothetical protein